MIKKPSCYTLLKVNKFDECGIAYNLFKEKNQYGWKLIDTNNYCLIFSTFCRDKVSAELKYEAAILKFKDFFKFFKSDEEKREKKDKLGRPEFLNLLFDKQM